MCIQNTKNTGPEKVAKKKKTLKLVNFETFQN